MGGTRFRQVYADDVVYEHIYLTGIYETWLGVKGPQAGRPTPRSTTASSSADGVYPVYWNEGILTVQMTFMFNFVQGRSVGESSRARTGNACIAPSAPTELIHTMLPELPNVTRLDMYAGE